MHEEIIAYLLTNAGLGDGDLFSVKAGNAT